jgi:CheY-like chemotaxis protein
MLAYSGKGRFVVEPVDIATLVRETLPLIQSSIPRTVQLRLDLDEPAPPAEVDVAQVQQLIMNLVINGAEAIPADQPGIVSIKVAGQMVSEDYPRSAGMHPSPATGSYVCIEVMDNGVGMDEATRARIFDPFYTTKFTGRGLGLATVSGIVRGHKGSIQVSSSPGQGAIFRILLPAVAGKPAEHHEPPAPCALSAGAGTVLVVDDESVVLHVAQQTLQRCGYDVLLAENGEAAIEIFRRHAADIRLVLLDMTMPVMSGEKTLLELRKIRPDVAVLLSSGYNQVEAIQRFAGQGLAGFLQKPYSSATLGEQVKLALEKSSIAPRTQAKGQSL